MTQKEAKERTWYVSIKSFGDFKEGDLSHLKGISTHSPYGQTAWFGDDTTYESFRLAEKHEIPKITKGSYWKATKDVYYGLGKEFWKNNIFESPRDGYLYPSGSNIACEIPDDSLGWHELPLS